MLIVIIISDQSP